MWRAKLPISFGLGYCFYYLNAIRGGSNLDLSLVVIVAVGTSMNIKFCLAGVSLFIL